MCADARSFLTLQMDGCLPLAQSLQADGKKWHLHVLSPGCRHNPFPAVYAVVIENDTDGVAYLAEGDESFPEVDKPLVKMLHGDDILDPLPQAAGPPQSSLLDHLNRLQQQGMEWHHHMHFPSCVFNPHPGSWSISIEAPGSFVSEAYLAEPVEVLRQVEVMYFRNLARKT